MSDSPKVLKLIARLNRFCEQQELLTCKIESIEDQIFRVRHSEMLAKINANHGDVDPELIARARAVAREVGAAA
jgi:hypothetical protein